MAAWPFTVGTVPPKVEVPGLTFTPAIPWLICWPAPAVMIRLPPLDRLTAVLPGRMVAPPPPGPPGKE